MGCAAVNKASRVGQSRRKMIEVRAKGNQAAVGVSATTRVRSGLKIG